MSSAVVAQVEHQIGDAGLLEALDGGQQVVVVGGVEAVVDDVSDVRTSSTSARMIGVGSRLTDVTSIGCAFASFLVSVTFSPSEGAIRRVNSVA